MRLAVFILILLVVVVVVVVVVGVLILSRFVKFSYYKCSEYLPGEIITDYLKNYNLTDSPSSANIYIPCGYTNVEKNLSELDPVYGQVILGIDGCDNIVSKKGLAVTLGKFYTANELADIIPKTWVATDVQKIVSDFVPGNLYILKKDVQKQAGLKLTRQLTDLMTAFSQGYVVVQEYIMNPWLIYGRKFDVRVFMIVLVTPDNTVHFYRHSGGRCHYSTKQFTLDHSDESVHIPSGYNEDSEFKAAAPHTLSDLNNYFGGEFLPRLDKLLIKCAPAFASVLANDSKFKKSQITMCQFFGLDFCINSAGQPLLIEINKGPEMGWSSPEEKEYKIQIFKDVMNLATGKKCSNNTTLLTSVNKMLD